LSAWAPNRQRLPSRASGALATAIAQARCPSKPIRLIVGFAPGGAVDIVARAVGCTWSSSLPMRAPKA
jgi:tripartite-type tricarboxylate transporter receptor subunit TctC